MKSYRIIRLCLVISTTHVAFVCSMGFGDAGAPPAAGAVADIKWERSSSFDEGITTTGAENDARGNWYIKRKFLIDARGVYEQIKQRIPTVTASEKTFLDLRDTITGEIAQFNTVVGMEPQQLDAALTATIASLEQERVKKEQLTEQERETLANLEVLKKELAQVQKDLGVFNDNVTSLMNAMPVLSQQMQVCAGYEQQAWDKYENISEVLNDHLAEQLYRDIQSYLNHINAIDTYIKGQFSDYFNQTVTMIRAQMDAIKTALKKLEEQGVVFESEAAKELREKQAMQHAEAHKQQQEKEQHAQTWYGKLLGFLKTLGLYIVYPFVWIGNQIARLWR